MSWALLDTAPVVISTAAVHTIGEEAEASNDGNETGGLLLGQLCAGHVHVRYAGGPGPAATRTPTRFLRDLQHARGLADAAWQLDRSVWIGEWHTHPAAGPDPSRVDMLTYAEHLADPDLTLPVFTSLIVRPGPDGSWTSSRLYAWSITDAGYGPVTVTVENTSDAREQP
jgi:integrative and conjugative element protein (TIGR02256 family)